jgi:hypothetical protein
MTNKAPQSMVAPAKVASPYGKDVMPTNAAKLSTLDRMLKAIKHPGRPSKSKTKPPFAS